MIRDTTNKYTDISMASQGADRQRIAENGCRIRLFFRIRIWNYWLFCISVGNIIVKPLLQPLTLHLLNPQALFVRGSVRGMKAHWKLILLQSRT